VNKKIVLMTVLVFLFSTMLATQTMMPVKAEGASTQDVARAFVTTGIWIGGVDPSGWYKIDPQGNTIVPMQGFWWWDYIQKMAYNPVDKTVWMVTFYGDRALKIDQNGNILRNVQTGRGYQTDINIDPRDGSVWIVSGYSSTEFYEGWLIKLDANGNKLFEKPLGGRPGSVGMSGLWLYQDCVWVNTNDGRILKFDLNGNLILQKDGWYEEGIWDIVVNEKDGTVWFTTTRGRMFKLDQQGETLLTKQLPIETGESFGLGIDPVTGHVWFTVAYIGKVIKVDQTGNILLEKKYDYLFATTVGNIVIDPSDGGAIIAGAQSRKVAKVDTCGNVIFVIDVPFSAVAGPIAVEYSARALQYYLTVQTEPIGITPIPGEDSYEISADVSLEAPTIVPISTGVQYRFDYWTVDDSVVSGNPITVHMDADHTATAHYVKQYYLTVISAYDTTGGEGWYDEGETAYATLAIGLDYVDTLAYGFVGWSGDASGWDLISEPIIMNTPKTAIANWEPSSAYGDVRTIIFWKYQANIWYFTERARTDLKIRGIGTAHISEEVFIAYLKFIDTNSDYFRGKIVKDNNGDGTITNLEILQNAYNFLKTPTGTDSMKMRAEQQLLALWLNLAYKAFFWNTQLSQDTLYIYSQYNFENDWGLTTIGEAILFCEAELLKPDGNYEAAKNICDSINNNLGIIWGT